jgi:hypothetical protein
VLWLLHCSVEISKYSYSWIVVISLLECWQVCSSVLVMMASLPRKNVRAQAAAVQLMATI